MTRESTVANNRARLAAGEPSQTPRMGRRVAVATVIGAVAVLAFTTFSLDHALVATFLIGTLVVLSAFDLERGVIPNRIVLPAAAVLLVMQSALFPQRAKEWILAALIAAGALAAPQLLSRAWIGFGDAKLALLIGAGLGWGALGAIPLAFVCVLPASLLLLARGGLRARNASVPFGPFLALGSAIVLFGPHALGLSPA